MLSKAYCHASIILCTLLLSHEIFSLFQILCYDTLILFLGTEIIYFYQKEKHVVGLMFYVVTASTFPP